MTSPAGPWSVKGIDPKAREMAKGLARRSGMTLGEWLNQMIVEGDSGDAPPFERHAPHAEPMALDSFRRSRHAGFGSEPDRGLRPLEALAARLEAAESRSTLAISGIDQSVMGVLSRIEGIERDQFSVAARLEGDLDEVRDAQARLGERLRRADEGEAARVDALKALEASLGKVAAQLNEAEGRARNALSETREDMAGVQRRMERLESRSETSDGEMVAKLVERVAEAERRTNSAVRALEASFAGLDDRLAQAEARTVSGEAAAERRFTRLATELSEKVEASRAEMAQNLQGSTGGKLDRMEANLAALTGHVEAAEQRSVDAIDRMGREVVRIAQTIGSRVQAVETRSAQAVEQVGSEMARIADAMEVRMRSADAAQAEALERLGDEIGRIAEKLADRIAATERRSALAIDDVGDQVVRVTEKIQQRYDNIAGDLATRIRQSEERTARVLDEARSRLDQRIAEGLRFSAVEAAMQAQPKPAPDLSPAPAYVAPTFRAPSYAPPSYKPSQVVAEAPAPAPHVEPADAGAEEAELDTAAFEIEAFADEDGFVTLPFAEEPAQEAEAEPEATQRAEVEAEFEPAAPADEAFEFELAESSITDPFDPFVEATFTDAEEAEAPAEAEVEAVAPVEEAVVFDTPTFGSTPARERPLDGDLRSGGGRNVNRDLLDAARAAARAASSGDRGRRSASPQVGEAASRGFTFGLPRKKKKKENGPTLRTALLASGTAATLSMAVAGYGLLSANHANEAAKPLADPALLAGGASSPATPPPAASADAAASAPTDVATAPPASTPAPDTLAVAIAPQALSSPAPAPAPTPAPAAPPSAAEPAVQPAKVSNQAHGLYLSGVRQIEAGDPIGLEPLRRAANLGDAEAQFYLSKLYESGGAGLHKDIVEARRWTERSAQGGDPKAMHNLGLYFFEGAGGEKSTAEAAAWFRRAADLGLQDSQYNLARLYEEGFGVSKNLAEAYKWYLIAGTGGDAEARLGAERVRKQLPAEAQTTAQRSAAGFKAPLLGSIRGGQ